MEVFQALSPVVDGGYADVFGNALWVNVRVN